MMKRLHKGYLTRMLQAEIDKVRTAGRHGRELGDRNGREATGAMEVADDGMGTL